MELTLALPGSHELEKNIIGCMLESSRNTQTVFKIIGPEAFNYERKIAEVLYAMMNEGAGIDIVTVCEYSRGKIDYAKIVSYATSALYSVNLEYYCRILYQYALARSLTMFCHEAIKEIGQGGDVLAIHERLKNEINIPLPTKANDNKSIAEVTTMGDLLETMKTGYKCIKLPWKYNGFKIEIEYKQLVILAAEPSVGKTALVLNICFDLGQNGVPNAIIVLESSASILKRRMLSMASGVYSAKIKRGTVNDYELGQVEQANEMIDKMPLYINESAYDSISIEHCIRDLNAKGVQVFFIDNLSNVKLPDAERTDLKIGEFLKVLTRLKKELGVTIFLISHLNREGNTKKALNDRLRNSGEIAQDADVIMFVLKDELNDAKRILKCTKNRDDELFEVELTFSGKTQQFKDGEYTEFETVFDTKIDKRADLDDLEF